MSEDNLKPKDDGSSSGKATSTETPNDKTNVENIENIEKIEKVEIQTKSLVNYMTYLPHLLIGFFGIILLLGIGYMFITSKVNFFSSADPVVARGLITFLVAVVTIAIAVILTLSVILSNSPDFKERFALGKEILTILIGVLGTIIGFYFGSAEKTPIVNVNPIDVAAVGTNQNLQISVPNLSIDRIDSSSVSTLTSFVSGGKMPYRYKITFDPNLVDAVSAESLDGIIKTEVKKNAISVDKETNVSYQIEVNDAENKTTVLTKDKAKKFLVSN